MPVCDAPFGEVVGRPLQGHAIAGENPDAVAPEFAGQVRQNNAVQIELNAEQAARKFFNYGSSNFNIVFFAHSPPWGDYNSGWGQNLRGMALGHRVYLEPTKSLVWEGPEGASIALQ